MTQILRGPLKAAIGSFAMEDANPIPVPFRVPVVEGAPAAPVEAVTPPIDSDAENPTPPI